MALRRSAVRIRLAPPRRNRPSHYREGRFFGSDRTAPFDRFRAEYGICTTRARGNLRPVAVRTPTVVPDPNPLFLGLGSAGWAAVAAIVALLALVLTFVRGRTRLRVRARADQLFFVMGQAMHAPQVRVDVELVSGPPTTIKEIGLSVYRRKWHRILDRPPLSAVANSLRLPPPVRGVAFRPSGTPLPKRLDVGESWSGFLDQSEVESYLPDGIPFIVVSHVASPHGAIAEIEGLPPTLSTAST